MFSTAADEAAYRALMLAAGAIEVARPHTCDMIHDIADRLERDETPPPPIPSDDARGEIRNIISDAREALDRVEARI